MRSISLESWEKTLRVCLTAPAFLARQAAAVMETQGGGVIINITSVMAKMACGLAPAYVAAQGGLDALSADLAALYGRGGVRVLSLAPGAFDAPTGHDYGPAQSALRTHSEQMIPLGRWASAQEIASAVAWLASDEARYITGTEILVDGGLMARGA
jgi:3-oxoacyl-[acyl-carrier protein] reductase